ncbi:MAG: CinA family protein, partial [Candidatus Nanopelagicales bacterium]
MKADEVVSLLVERGQTVATAESLTGGLVCAELTSIPGASACVRGGLVSYAVAVKADVLGVDADLLERQGAVDPAVAVHMALGAR